MTQPIPTNLDRVYAALVAGPHPVRRGGDRIMVDFDVTGREAASVEIGTQIDLSEMVVSVVGYDHTGGVDSETYLFTTANPDLVAPLLDAALTWAAQQDAKHEYDLSQALALAESGR